MNPSSPSARCRTLVAIALLAIGSMSAAQPTTPPAATPAAPAPAAAPAAAVVLSDLSWLSGCWRGSVNQRDFREHWLPLRGNLLIGAGHTVVQDRTQNFEYVRIESRDDGLHYVAQPSAGKELSFRLADRQVEGVDTIFTFASDAGDFPQRIVYRRGAEGWLFIHVEGRVQGEERRVIYPLRRIDCESGDLIAK